MPPLEFNPPSAPNITTMAGEPLLYLHIFDTSNKESYPVRGLQLKAPLYSCRLGRGSLSGDQSLFPRNNNGYFESRVMSREHAVIEADPYDKTILIRDLKSMHGTEVNGVPLVGDGTIKLRDGDAVKFGQSVTRGMDSFAALEATVRIKWYKNEADFLSASGEIKSPRPPSRGFSVPEASDDEFDDDDESDVEYLGEDIRSPSVEVILPPLPPRVPSVPSSEVSAKIDVVHDLYETETDDSLTSPSSPEEHPRKTKESGTGDDKTLTTLASTSLPAPKFLLEDVVVHDSFDDYNSDSEMADDFFAEEQNRQPYPDLCSLPVPPIDASLLTNPRAPSPSDAAMAKSSNTVPSSAGHNSQHFGDELTTYHTATSSNFQNTSVNSYGGYYPVFGSASVIPPVEHHDYLNFQSHQPDHNWPSSSTSDAYNLPQLTADTSHAMQESTNGPQPTSMASLDLHGLPLHAEDSSLKRKLDVMSQASNHDSMGLPVCGSTKRAVQMGPTSTVRTQGEEKEVESIASRRPPAESFSAFSSRLESSVHENLAEWEKQQDLATTADPVAAPETDSGRPSKRLRLTYPPRRDERAISSRPTSTGASAASYAATALGWMAVGAVGAIWALVSLPEDFFA